MTPPNSLLKQVLIREAVAILQSLTIAYYLDDLQPSNNLTPLLPTISSLLKSETTRERLESRHMRHPITLAAMFVRNVIGYLTDLRHSIQMYLEFKLESKPLPTPALSPSNLVESKYYRIIEHHWQPFNCDQQYLLPPSNEPLHPYCPEFYFKKDYQGLFEQKKNPSRSMAGMKILKITEWRLKMVNVSGSGYYAPTIYPLKQETVPNLAPLDSQFISCIVYQPEIKNVMEKMRLSDWRRAQQGKMPEKEQLSLNYYKILIPTKPKRPNVSMMGVDKQGKLIKCNYNPNHCKFVLTCDPGNKAMCTLQSPVYTDRIDTQRIISSTLNQILGQMPPLPAGKVSRRKKKHQHQQVWDSESEDEESEPARSEIIIDEDDEESAEDEDPLKALYQKQISSHRRV